MRHNNRGLVDFLKTYAPDFCWCSAYDLLILVEQELRYENVTESSLAGTLSYLKKQGFFITKKVNYRSIHNERGKKANLYLRVK